MCLLRVISLTAFLFSIRTYIKQQVELGETISNNWSGTYIHNTKHRQKWHLTSFFCFSFMKNIETKKWKVPQTIIFPSAPYTHVLESTHNQLLFCDILLIFLVHTILLICPAELWNANVTLTVLSILFADCILSSLLIFTYSLDIPKKCSNKLFNYNECTRNHSKENG